ncbi:MAG: hypothetical protein DELT_01872 [Desulfovibrio sp.]
MADRASAPHQGAYQMTLPGMGVKHAPFLNVSWNRPFLPALLDIALALSGNDLEKVCFVFPHGRPALYLMEHIKEDARIEKPCILPRMLPVSSLFALARGLVAAERSTSVGLLDQVALLLAAVREIREERGGLLRDLPLDDSRRFFPWGVRLANLMEEFFTHNRVPEDYMYMQDQATPFAAAILENLGALHTRYLTLLEERAWTTPGLDSFLVARALAADDFVPQLPVIAGKTVILAGFHTLTGSQRAFFRHLWAEHGATVCLHADENVVSGSPHWSCVPLVRWASAWRTKIEPYETREQANEAKTKTPEITFQSGYDVHSQLQALTEDIRAEDLRAENFRAEKTSVNAGEERQKTSRAVVLPDTSLLLPVLHHLPDTDVNISMGYPLARSPLFRLVESIISLQENRRGTGPYAYHWKGLVELFRHPYIKMLNPMADMAADVESDAGPEKIVLTQGFRRFLHHAERVVRASHRFSRVSSIAAQAAETYAQAENEPPHPALAALFAKVLDTAIFAWEDIASPDGIALALQGVTDLMHDHGKALWTHFPIDAECLYRLTESIIPQLAHTALKEETLPADTLFTVLRGLLAAERVPFEAYPLVGNQVLGVLETRLLHFEKVYLIDATEDRLPGTKAHDPLLPDSLRPLMGLPGSRGRETVAAYNFFRLINGADTVSIYWQEGVETKGLNDTKKTRSRFVEELLWREETKRGAILAPEKPENKGQDGPLRLISCVLPSVPREHAAIPMTEAAKIRMRAILDGELSPSLLDAYLRCPAQFFYQRIGRINEVEGVTEGRDPLGTGLFLHDVLRRYFTERIGKPITAGDASVAAMRALFLQEVAASPLRDSLPLDDRIMLEEAGPLILASMLENHEGRTPLCIEEKFAATIDTGGLPRTLAGFIDRVDEYGGSLVVMDYKTGRSPLIRPGVWEDEELWDALTAWNPHDGSDTFDAVAERFSSIQLPVYVYMAGRQTGRPVHDAAYVPLRMGEKDTFLLGPKMDGDLRRLALTEKIPALIIFILRHMENATSFTPRPGANCNWCLYKNLCIVASQNK